MVVECDLRTAPWIEQHIEITRDLGQRSLGRNLGEISLTGVGSREKRQIEYSKLTALSN